MEQQDRQAHADGHMTRGNNAQVSSGTEVVGPATLERLLRTRLESVELVCDAGIADDLVDAAEAVIRPLCGSSRIETAAGGCPATLVTYFVIRGSERYEFNRVWPHLGVTSRSSHAGRALLAALRRLGLPTFEDEVAAVRARTFVAPMLMHGAFPSSVAVQFVERIERELRRGLVDSSEARRRLIRDPDLVSEVGRPAARLLDWAPDYAERLIDAVIDHIEDPSGQALAQLPVHLQTALSENTERRSGLRRVQPPLVEFQTWTGFGPEVVAPSMPHSWRLQVGDRTVRLQPADRIEVSPNEVVLGESDGRRLTLWMPAPWRFFDMNGRPIPDDSSLPSDCMVLLPRKWQLSNDSGNPVPEVEEGVPMSGSWSSHRSARISLHGVSQVTVASGVANDVVAVRQVRPDRPVYLDGATASAVAGPDHGVVHTAVPSVVVPDLVGAPLSAWFVPVSGSDRYARVERGESTTSYALSELIGSAATSGTLIVRTGSGKRESMAVTVVPDLAVSLPSFALAPGQSGSLEVTAAHNVHSAPETISFGPQVTAVDLEIPGLPSGSIRAHLPRVQWGLRSPQPGRLDLQPGTITTELAVLSDEPSWLIVRCALPSRVGLRLQIDGTDVQEISARATTVVGIGAHHRSIDLGVFRDTLRAASSTASVQLILDVDATAMVAVQCGTEFIEPDDAKRSWGHAEQIEQVQPNGDGSTWSSVPWMSERGDAPSLTGSLDKSARSLELRLRLADDANAVVIFLRLLGERSRSWKLAEFPHGPSGDEWKALCTVADALWRTEGQRYRLFGAGEFDAKLRQWTGSRREQLRRASADERSRIERWLLGRVPDRERLSGWTHIEWIEHALPPKSTVGVQWLPATVLYHCVLLIAGDDDSGPLVADAATVDPVLLLETVAFVMHALWTGVRFCLPELDDREGCGDEEHDGSDQQVIAVAGPSPVGDPALLTECILEVSGHRLEILGPDGSAPPTVRFSRKGRAEYVSRSIDEAGVFIVDIPEDISGRLTVQFVVGRELLNQPGDGAALDVTAVETRRSSTGISSKSLANIGHANIDALTNEVVDALATGRLGDAPFDRLFEDEKAAGRALLRLVHRCSDEHILDRVAIAALPASMLFTRLFETSATDSELVAAVRHSRLMYACLAPRTNGAWGVLGWPSNIGMGPTTGAAQALAGWARRLALTLGPVDGPTWRYAHSSTLNHHQLLRQVIRELERHNVDPGFIDAFIATHRMLSYDCLIPEALRMLLEAHTTSPSGVSGAVLAGIAAHLITTT